MTPGTFEAARAQVFKALRSLSPRDAQPRLRRPWRWVTFSGLGRALLGLAGAGAVLALLGFGVFMALLARGPIDLDNLKPSIARNLEERLGPRYKVAIGHMSLMRGSSGLGIGFGDMEIRDGQGRIVVAAPGGKVGLDVLALLTGEVKVRRLELDGLALKIRVRPDGAISAAASASKDAASLDLGPPAEGSAPLDVATVTAGLIETMAGSTQALDHVSLVNGRLDVANEALSRDAAYQDFSLAFDRDGEAAKIAIGAKGPSGAWKMTASANAGKRRGLSIEAHDLGLADLLALSKSRPPFDSDMPISVKVEAALTTDGKFKSFKGEFGLGAGYFETDDPDQEPFLVDEATGKFVWDAEAGRYRIEDVEALASNSHFRVSGWVAPPTPTDAAWRGNLHSADSVLAGERPGEQAVVIDDAVLDAHFVPAETRLYVDRLAVHGPRVKAELKGEVASVPEGTTMKLDLKAGPGGIIDMLRLWPSSINPEARGWCQENIKGGELVSGFMKLDWDAKAFDLALRKQPVPPDSVHGEFVTRDAAVALLPGVPVAMGLDASGVITGRVFSVAAKHGTMELAQGRRIQATDITFKVPDTSPAPVVASQGNAKLFGSADALADLLSRDAIKHYAGFAVDPATVKGQFQGQLTLFLGLGKDVRPEDQKFRADGTLSNLQLDKFLSNERFEQGALEVQADSANLKITGQGSLNGLPAKVELTKAGAEEGTLMLNLSLDDAARARMGLNLGPALAGPMGVHVKAPLGKSGMDVEVDLAKVAVESPEGATLKAAGKAGKATFTVKSTPDAIAVGSLVVDAGAIQAKGTAQFSPEGAMQSVKLASLRLSPGDDLKLDLTGGPVMKAVVRGAALDARGLIKAFMSHDPNAGGARDVDVDMKIANVVGANKQSLAGFELQAARRGGAMKSLTAKGQLGEGPLVVRRDDAGVTSVRAEDAGAFGRFVDIYGKMEGGTLELTLRDTSEGSQGVASIRKFTLRNEPALKRMAAAGVPTTARGDPGQSVPIDSDAVKFERMTANFTRSAGRLDLHEALIFNPEFGLTTQGYIDYAHDKVDLNGTFVPAYQVNSLITHVPVVGVLLGGGQHEGIFGVNYRITGPASGPTLNVNPLSGVTPGILRKIFGVVDGTTPPPNSYAPQPGQ